MTETKKKIITGTVHHKSAAKEKEPEYMVQVSDPKVLRKDLLESVRDIIIFMQGYEKFRKIQEEKVSTFGLLRTQVKEINSMVEKLKTYMPKGKLKSVGISEFEEYKEEKIEIRSDQPNTSRNYNEIRTSPNELEELESQLKDIEGQLKNIQ